MLDGAAAAIRVDRHGAGRRAGPPDRTGTGPGGPAYDLHQGNLRVDERATGIGARVLANVAVGALVTDL